MTLTPDGRESRYSVQCVTTPATEAGIQCTGLWADPGHGPGIPARIAGSLHTASGRAGAMVCPVVSNVTAADDDHSYVHGLQ